jgi:hypothetical protein
MPIVRAGAAKWRARASAAQSDYLEGIRRPRRTWREGATEAVDAWAAGIQQALADGRYARGLTPEAEQLWRQRVETVGAQRYSQGIQQSGDRYERNFAPYRQVIESLQLPPRGPSGDPRNLERVRVVAEALHNAKRRLRGGG